MTTEESKNVELLPCKPRRACAKACPFAGELGVKCATGLLMVVDPSLMGENTDIFVCGLAVEPQKTTKLDIGRVQ